MKLVTLALRRVLLLIAYSLLLVSCGREERLVSFICEKTPGEGREMLLKREIFKTGKKN